MCRRRLIEAGARSGRLWRIDMETRSSPGGGPLRRRRLGEFRLLFARPVPIVCEVMSRQCRLARSGAPELTYPGTRVGTRLCAVSRDPRSLDESVRLRVSGRLLRVLYDVENVPRDRSSATFRLSSWRARLGSSSTRWGSPSAAPSTARSETAAMRSSVEEASLLVVHVARRQGGRTLCDSASDRQSAAVVVAAVAGVAAAIAAVDDGLAGHRGLWIACISMPQLEVDG